MPGLRNRAIRIALGGLAAIWSALLFAAPASAACSSVIADFVPGFHGISCHYADGPEQIWTVPTGITKPKFSILGADDAVGGRGGFVSARLPVEAGELINLKLGTDGEASSVSRDGEELLVAGGGNGAEPNYLSPEAEVLEVKEPGEPLAPNIGNGAAYLEWYDARKPFELTYPLAYVIVDIFDSEKAGFAYTGSGQEWIVPPEVDYALFELFGGKGSSGEPRGHILAGLEVEPGEAFELFVGGPGGDTTLVRAGSFDVGVAAGGDSERPNYLPSMASPADEFWEGGGPESVPGNGYAIVHYWPPKSPIGQPGEQREPKPPVVQTQESLPPCIVPRLHHRTVRAARSALLHANCGLGRVVHRGARGGRPSWIVRQRPRAGAVAAPGTKVEIVVAGAAG